VVRSDEHEHPATDTEEDNGNVPDVDANLDELDVAVVKRSELGVFLTLQRIAPTY